MEKTDNSVSMIGMFPYPVFCVKDGIIIETNQLARQRQINAGVPISQLLNDHAPEYEAFTGGCLSLSVHVDGAEYIATVLRSSGTDVFHLCDEHINERLCAMSLAAQQMGQPLTDVMTASEYLIAGAAGRNSGRGACLKKSLHQLQRLVNNISAANTYAKGRLYGMEVRDITALLAELFSRAEALVHDAGRNLKFSCPSETVYCPVDEEMLEKAVYNLISNAVKGSPKKGVIDVKVTVDKNKLRLSIENTDNGLGRDVENLFFRYMRAPQIEDGRHGLGLGIPLVQFAAAAHNGTLLMDRPSQDTIRFTMTISTTTRSGDILRSPIMLIDSFGGWDHGLVELADVLPPSAFEHS